MAAPTGQRSCLLHQCLGLGGGHQPCGNWESASPGTSLPSQTLPSPKCSMPNRTSASSSGEPWRRKGRAQGEVGGGQAVGPCPIRPRVGWPAAHIFWKVVDKAVKVKPEPPPLPSQRGEWLWQNGSHKTHPALPGCHEPETGRHAAGTSFGVGLSLKTLPWLPSLPRRACQSGGHRARGAVPSHATCSWVLWQ